MSGYRKNIFDLHPVINVDSPVPQHIQLSDSIMHELQQRNVPLNTNMPPILTLATALQMNRDTVRKAYATLEKNHVITRPKNGRIFSVSPEFVRSLTQRQLMTIGIVLPERMEKLMPQQNRPAMEVVTGIMDTAADSGIAGMIVPLPEHKEELLRLSGWLERMIGRLDGLIYLGESRGHCHDEAFELLLAKTAVPQVFIAGYNRFREHLGLVQVDLDKGFSQALEYLHKRGFERIAIASHGIPVRKNFQLQTMTRFEMLKELSQKHPAQWSIIAPDNDKIQEHFRKIFSETLRPQAVFCGDESIGEAVYAAACAHHISVPEELEIVCFGKVYSNRHLAEICQPFFETGRAAVNMITASWRNRTPIKQLDTILPTVFHTAEKNSANTEKTEP